MSPPAQKDLPTARTTSAPISGFASTSSNVAISSSAIEGVSALRRSGAFSVTIAAAPSTSSSTSPEPATSPPLSQEADAAAGQPARITPRRDRRTAVGTRTPPSGTDHGLVAGLAVLGSAAVEGESAGEGAPLRGLRVAVLGPGGVGALLAALLARAGAAVTCLAGADTVRTLRTTGVRVDSRLFGTFTTPVQAVEQLSEPVDVCFVSVKSTHLDAALQRVPADVLGNALLVPLLNGIEHVDLLRQRYPAARVVPATIRVESTRTEAGVVLHTSPFVVVELTVVGEFRAQVQELTDDLQQAGLSVRLSDNEQEVLWSKLNFLAPFALLTTHEQATAGEVRERNRDDLRALVAEVAAVARAEGAVGDDQQVLTFFDSVPAGMRSSMQRDAEAGRPMELDAIGAAVVRLADRHGIAVPVTARYVGELRARHPSQT